MYLARGTPIGPSWQGPLRDLAMIVNTIRRSRSFGRLTLRNTTRLGVAHLYFDNGKLVHIVGNRGNAQATLNDLQNWTRATIRFEHSHSFHAEENSEGYEQPFDGVLAQLQRRGVVINPNPTPTPAPIASFNMQRSQVVDTSPSAPSFSAQRSQVVEGHLIATPRAERLLTPFEWRVLVEGIRRVSLAVAHLVGPNEALSALRDILDDCTAAFPALAGIQIAPSGYLQVTDTSQFDRMPRAEILEGFAALIAICQHFCTPIIGEGDAHKLLIQALNDVGPAMVSLGVFQVNNQLLSRHG